MCCGVVGSDWKQTWSCLRGPLSTERDRCQSDTQNHWKKGHLGWDFEA